MWVVKSFDRERHATAQSPGRQAAAVASPDKEYVAKIWLPDLDGLGATISQPHQVWVEGKRGSRLILEADKTDEIRLRWQSARQLEICYADAQIHRFSNRFVDVDRSGSITEAQTVEATLRRVKQLDECRM